MSRHTVDRYHHIQGASVKLLIIDADGVLTRKHSWLKFTEKIALLHKDWTPTQIENFVQNHIRIFTLFKRGLLDHDQMVNRLMELWQEARGESITKKEIEQLADELAVELVTQEAFDAIQVLKDLYCVAIVSASFDLYVASLANRLNILHARSNSKLLFAEDGRFQGFRYFNEEEAKKMSQIDTLIEDLDIRHEETVLVDDEIGVGLADWIRIVALAHSSPELRKRAWIVIDSIAELPAALDKKLK